MTKFKLNIKLGPKIKDTAEAFGMKADLFDDIALAAAKFMALQIGTNMLNKAGKRNAEGSIGNKVEIFKKFLESNEFTALKWEPKNANDFFLLGMVFQESGNQAKHFINDFLDEMADQPRPMSPVASFLERVGFSKRNRGNGPRVTIEILRR